MEREMNAAHCGAQFAMLKSIKLHGGKTVLNTIKAIKGEEKGKYINSKEKKKNKISVSDEAMQNISRTAQKKTKRIPSELTRI